MSEGPRPPLYPHRPPTILSEYGEGYCAVCKFVVGLNYDGQLERHSRGVMISPRECKGSLKKPPKVTPYASRSAAFRAIAKKVACYACNRQVIVLNDGRMAGHTLPHSVTYCSGGYNVPRPPDRVDARKVDTRA